MRKLLIFLATLATLAAQPVQDVNPKKNEVLIHKQFFTHTGPEEPSERKITFGKALQNFRVLFVNIPSPSAQLRQNEAKPLQVSLAPVEEKLAIYVLSPKKTKQKLEIVDLVAPTQILPVEPEVHFLKYKDEREVQETQKRIKDHYLALD